MKNYLEQISKHPVVITIIGYLLAFAWFTNATWDKVEDKAIFFRLFIVVSCFMVYAFFLCVRQFREVIRPRNWLTGLRILILITLILTTITLIPSIFNLYFTAIGQQYSGLRTISVIVGSINFIGSTLILVLIYTYRKKDD